MIKENDWYILLHEKLKTEFIVFQVGSVDGNIIKSKSNEFTKIPEWEIDITKANVVPFVGTLPFEKES
jgi:hypothetical protein